MTDLDDLEAKARASIAAPHHPGEFFKPETAILASVTGPHVILELIARVRDAEAEKKDWMRKADAYVAYNARLDEEVEVLEASFAAARDRADEQEVQLARWREAAKTALSIRDKQGTTWELLEPLDAMLEE